MHTTSETKDNSNRGIHQPPRMMENATEEQKNVCAEYETYTDVRFVLIVAATVIAALGTVGNILLAYIFCAKKAKTIPPTLYPTVLALLDFAICFEYILLFGMDAVVSFTKIESLFVLYYLYIIPAYVLSRITQLAIPYMLIFATLERLVWTSHNIRNQFLKSMYSEVGRYVTVIVTLSCCVLLRLPTGFAMEVGKYPLCDDYFRTMTTQPKNWTRNSDVYYAFDFHLMTLAQTLVPFILLVVLNWIIVQKLGSAGNEKEHLPNISPTHVNVHKSSSVGIGMSLHIKMSPGVRSAIYTMCAIVASYLISNILHLILTIMERSDHPWLKDEEDELLSSAFHTFFSDAVSFVYMFTSAIRLIIYYLCNPAIRGDIRAFLCRKYTAVPVDM